MEHLKKAIELFELAVAAAKDPKSDCQLEFTDLLDFCTLNFSQPKDTDDTTLYETYVQQVRDMFKNKGGLELYNLSIKWPPVVSEQVLLMYFARYLLRDMRVLYNIRCDRNGVEIPRYDRNVPYEKQGVWARFFIGWSSLVFTSVGGINRTI